MVLPDFKAGNHLVLTDVINLNSWFLTLMKFYCILPLECWLSWVSSIISISYISVRGFITPFDKEPPDPGGSLGHILLELFWDLLPTIPTYFYMPRFMLEIFTDYIRATLQSVLHYCGIWKYLPITTDSHNTNEQLSENAFHWDFPASSPKPISNPPIVSSSTVSNIISMNSPINWRFRRPRVIKCYSAISLATLSKNEEHNIDTDSINFGIDTCTSDSICNRRELFVGDIKRCRSIFIEGLGGKIQAEGYGTIKIRVIDDNGLAHDLIIHNVLYVPASSVNLLSPQRWAEGNGGGNGIFEATFAHCTVLFWSDQKFIKTIPHHPDSNIPIMAVNEGFTSYSLYVNHMPKHSEVKTPEFLYTSKLADPKSYRCTICPSVSYRMASSHILTDKDDGEEIIPTSLPLPDFNSDLDSIDKSVSQSSEHVNPFELTHGITTQDNTSEPVEITTQDNPSKSLEDTPLIADDLEFADDIKPPCDLGSIPQSIFDKLAAMLSKNMTKDQEFLVDLHERCKHLPFRLIRKMAERGDIPKKYATTPFPICAGCLFGTQRRRARKHKGKKSHSIRRPEDNFPGANTSTDQLVSSHPGLIPQRAGRLMKARYVGAGVYVDHHSDYTYSHLMRDFTAEATLDSKHGYERRAATYQVDVRGYHADNGRYADPLFIKDVEDCGQRIRYCGVGGHHQNGVAERRIGTLQQQSRTVLSHARHFWPEAVKLCLWPFALKDVTRVYNWYNIGDDGLTPEERFSQMKIKRDLRHEHTLFCPVYVLDAKLQGGISGLPKWEPRSRVGVYLGQSPHHASNVALVLNLKTGLVSPQFHVVFDDNFTTVKYLRSGKEPPNWDYLVENFTENYDMPDSAPLFEPKSVENTVVPDFLPADSATLLDEIEKEDMSVDAIDEPSTSVNCPPSSPFPSDTDDIIFTTPSSEGAPTSAEGETPLIGNLEAPEGATVENHSPLIASSEGVEHSSSTVPFMDYEQDALDNSTRRSTRHKIPSEKLKCPQNKGLGNLRKSMGLFGTYFISTFMTTVASQTTYAYASYRTALQEKITLHESKFLNHHDSINMNADGTLNTLHPLSYQAKKAENDTFTFKEAMQEDDREEFIRAMLKEIEDHQERKYWKAVDRSTIGNAKVIQAIWSFKRKRRPDGTLIKHKARLCAHGGMQTHGINFWDTYAPVVNWMSIRTLLILSTIHKHHTRSIDFTLAFPQAETDVTIYMEIPLGCSVPEGGDYVCLLLKNLYGLKQAAKTWFEYLRDSLVLEESAGGYGLKQSQIDPCIFYKEGLTLITWVDESKIDGKIKLNFEFNF